jgi:flagellin-like hook-associated protein FlgL
MPPLRNIQESNNVASEFLDSAQGGSGSVDTFVDDFSASLPTHVKGGDGGILNKFCLADCNDHSPALNRNIFDDGIVEMPTKGRAAVNKAAAALTTLASFLSSFGMVQNRFTNQNSELNDEGYDSEGNLPHFADANLNNDMDEYNEPSIKVGGGAVASSSASAMGCSATALPTMATPGTFTFRMSRSKRTSMHWLLPDALPADTHVYAPA